MRTLRGAHRVEERCLGFIVFILAPLTLSGCWSPSSVRDAESASATQLPATENTPNSSVTNNAPSFAEQAARVRDGNSKIIHIDAAAITRAQVTELVALDQLQDLFLDAGGIDDDSVKQLNMLTQLEHLRIRQAEITDAGIEQLDPTQLPKLKILNLPQAKLTARGLKHLTRFPELIQLRLGGSEIDDMGASALAQFPSLKSLHLIGPRFTDQALQSLAEAPKLASLYIDDCRLSDNAWEQLFKSKPSLHVHIDQLHHDRDPNLTHAE